MVMSFRVKTTSSVSSNPLFSSIVTLYALIFLYLPTHFTTIALSTVLIITFALLLSLLRLGASQSQKRRNDAETASNDTEKTVVQAEEDHDREDDWSETDSEPEPGPGPGPVLEASFVQWDLRAPLEVIYEDEEEEEEGIEENDTDLGVVKFGSLSRYFPESDSDNSSEGDISGAGFCDSPENLRFKWEEEDRDEGLIEIALDGGDESDCKKKRLFDFHVDEDNFIEIDISAQGINSCFEANKQSIVC